MKVLISAYAFNPIGSMQLHPGDDLVGWRPVQYINEHYDIGVIIYRYKKESIGEESTKRNF